MTVLQATRTKASSAATRSGRLFLLELSGDRIHSMNPDGTDRETIVTNCHLPDGIAVDAEAGHIYWTDRGDPPRGNTVNRAPVDDKPQAPEIVLTHLMEGIGIALDVAGDRMFVTDFAGSIYAAKLDGSEARNFLYAQGNLTGIAYTKD